MEANEKGDGQMMVQVVVQSAYEREEIMNDMNSPNDSPYMVLHDKQGMEEQVGWALHDKQEEKVGL